jgi:hypothetical protein
VSGNGDFCRSSSPLPLNQWSSVTIQNKKINQDMYYTVTVNGVELHNGINKTPKSWSNVAVWASDNFYLGAKAMIKNAILTTGGYEYSLKKNAIQKSPIGGTGIFLYFI